MAEKVTLGEAKERLPELIKAVHESHEQYIIVQDGEPQAAVIPAEEYAQLQVLAERERRRQHILTIILPAASSPEEWAKGFEELEAIVAKTAPLTDDELIQIALEAQAEIRKEAANL